MKKNTMMRLAAVLLVSVLLTTSVIGGTFAKYVTSDSATDTARVAEWGVVVEVTGEEAFAKTYNDTATGTQVVSETEVVAPGTKGTLCTTTITGAPEVAVRVTKTAAINFEGWIVDGVFYCPIIITINGWEFKGLDYVNNRTAFEAAIENYLTAVKDYAANTDLSTANAGDYTIEWKWLFTSGDDHDVKDTALGDLAAGGNAPTITFEYTIKVEQLD